MIPLIDREFWNLYIKNKNYDVNVKLWENDQFYNEMIQLKCTIYNNLKFSGYFKDSDLDFFDSLSLEEKVTISSNSKALSNVYQFMKQNEINWSSLNEIREIMN